jgi:LAO/AO transport system kinase
LTSAKSNKGISEFVKKLKELIIAKKKTKKLQEQSRLETELRDIVLNNVKNKVSTMLDSSSTYTKYLRQVQSKTLDPYEAAEKISKLFK